MKYSFIRVFSIIMCLCMLICTFSACGETSSPDYSKISFIIHSNDQTVTPTIIYVSNEEEFSTALDTLFETELSYTFPTNELAIHITFKESYDAKDEVNALQLNLNTESSSAYDKNIAKLYIMKSNFDSEVLKTLSSSEKVQAISVQFIMTGMTE